MAETKERRRAPRKNRSTLKPDSQAGNARMDASPEEIRRLIEEAAYYRAAERGFTPGHELEDWIQAESEVMRRVERSG
jgi:hypothetical protein